MAGGFALVTNNDVAPIADNAVPNEVSNISDNNVSLENNISSANNVSLFDTLLVTKDISNNNIARGFSLGDNQIEAFSNNVFQLASNVADEDSSNAANSNSPFNVRTVAYAAHNEGSDVVFYPIHDDSFDPASNINRSEYVLSPNYAEHIFVKIGEDFTDMYGFCVADGCFIPLGNITKPIPNNHICNQSCGIGDCYYDLSSPYVYDYGNVSYYLANGEFGSEIQIRQQEYINNFYSTNYRQLEGHEDIYLNVHQDFTDKYLLCTDCGRYVPLGDVTTPLNDVMICDYPTHFGGITISMLHILL